MILAAEQVAAFRDKGWLRIDGVLDADAVASLLAQLEAHASSLLPAKAALGPDRMNYVEDDEFQRRHRLHPDVERVNDDLFSACVNTKLAAIARDLLGVDEVRFFHAKAMEKLPSTAGGTDTRMHQDFPTMPQDRSGQVVFWIALTDMPAEMGTLQFVDGSHRFGPLGRDPIVRTERDAIARRAEAEGWRLSPAPDLRAGDATVHLDLTVHYAGPNCTDRPRWALSAGYVDADCLYTGMPCRATDGLGLVVNQPFDHERFPIVR